MDQEFVAGVFGKGGMPETILRVVEEDRAKAEERIRSFLTQDSRNLGRIDRYHVWVSNGKPVFTASEWRQYVAFWSEHVAPKVAEMAGEIRRLKAQLAQAETVMHIISVNVQSGLAVFED